MTLRSSVLYFSQNLQYIYFVNKDVVREPFLMTLLPGDFSVYIQYKVMLFCRWGLRDQEKKQQEARRREILVLIHHHLLEEGLKEAADILGTERLNKH